MKIKKHLSFVPNTITSLNVLSGSFAVWNAFEGNLGLSAIFIFAAAIFDFFDGLSARLLGAYSDVGKELDSLADVISFGLAPSVIAYSLIRQMAGIEGLFTDLSIQEIALAGSAFLIVILSALRLAKFNVDTRQTSSFIGLPTPANALFFCSFAFLATPESWLFEFLQNHLWVFIALIVLMSLMLVAEIPLFALKLKNLSWRDNWFRYLFVAFGIVMAVTLKLWAIPIIILAYIISGVVSLLVNTKDK